MEIRQRPTGDVLELEIIGRLDASWADHLASALEAAVRAGAHRLRLDMAGVSYMSSVGVRVLVRFYKELGRIKGSFAVVNPSQPVRSVIELSGLGVLLGEPGGMAEPSARPAPAPSSRSLDHGEGRFEIFALDPGARLECTAVGDPRRLDGARFGADDCRALSFPGAAFGLGVGAFGESFAECRTRFGEFLAAAGAAAYLPTEGSAVPDVLIASRSFVPRLAVLYGVVCQGPFASLARFESHAGARAVSLATLASAALEISGGDLVGVVAVAESAGLVGAALRRSPAIGEQPGAPFAFPAVREWLSFAPERAHPRSLAIVVGIAARSAPPLLAPFLRPLGAEGAPVGHFHAAAFSYRPLEKGVIDLAASVGALFEGETLQGVLHLLSDDRDGEGIGQSELARGACWIGPIASVAQAGGGRAA